ncbi:GPW/gp25 family protein [Galbibacter sp. EGI 63066]|uniref:GPW/gp25 family protein n=1 Tax=Galbibacter sp. EGI 63066 TaxID=2993559 RepID=UPI002248FE3F|nr:GPW/gp25 family protein [Galbibacter sp. EGI 63066]MCX2680324.1 GPW/gp25 family protein [Galbibacter sp. EGI 63066]
MESNKAYLGTGWSFPPTFDKESETIKMVSAEKDIEQSMEILLSTSLGERVMQPEYGCNLKDYQFESMDNSFIGFIKDLVERAILYYEPRIRLENVEVTEADSVELYEGLLKINVDYRIEGSNTRYNYVYDFYLREADQKI